MRFEKSNRILIIGNSGSGKSWLAGKLAQRFGMEQFALDEIKWEKGGFYKEKEDALVKDELREISSRTNFVIEGVYGDLAAFLSDKASHLIWLDISSEECAQSALKRGFEHIPWMSSEKKINAYLEHIRSYERGSGAMSRKCHEEVFNGFAGAKASFLSCSEVNEFAATL